MEYATINSNKGYHPGNWSYGHVPVKSAEKKTLKNVTFDYTVELMQGVVGLSLRNITLGTKRAITIVTKGWFQWALDMLFS